MASVFPFIFIKFIAYCYIGCYADGTSGGQRDMYYWAISNSAVMTIELCVSTCLSLGFSYAGLQARFIFSH